MYIRYLCSYASLYLLESILKRCRHEALLMFSCMIYWFCSFDIWYFLWVPFHDSVLFKMLELRGTKILESLFIFSACKNHMSLTVLRKSAIYLEIITSIGMHTDYWMLQRTMCFADCLARLRYLFARKYQSCTYSSTGVAHIVGTCSTSKGLYIYEHRKTIEG